MRMVFKQRFFSWLDSYDIYDVEGATLYTVEGKMSFGHCLQVMDAAGNHVGTLKEKVFRFLPQFEIYIGDVLRGSVQKEFSFLPPKFHVDFNGWQVEGNFLEWDYEIRDAHGRTVASVSKEILHWTDTYVIDVKDPEDALYALMLVLAIDAEKCSRN